MITDYSITVYLSKEDNELLYEIDVFSEEYVAYFYTGSNGLVIYDYEDDELEKVSDFLDKNFIELCYKSFEGYRAPHYFMLSDLLIDLEELMGECVEQALEELDRE